MPENLIIFDVDRTLIAGTAWPRFLRSEHSPLSREAKDIFEDLDARRYHGKGPALPERAYRDAVLDLLDVREGAELPREMVRWGTVAAELMTHFPRPFEMLLALHADFPDAEVVYLTAGWEPFMIGLTDAISARAGMPTITTSVVGSVLDLEGGRWKSSLLMDGPAKAHWINERLDVGDRILLLADDQHHEILPFDRVIAAGGRGVMLKWDPGSDPWDTVTDE